MGHHRNQKETCEILSFSALVFQHVTLKTPISCELCICGSFQEIGPRKDNDFLLEYTPMVVACILYTIYHDNTP